MVPGADPLLRPRSSGGAGCPSSVSRLMFFCSRFASDVLRYVASSRSRNAIASERSPRSAASCACTSTAAPIAVARFGSESIVRLPSAATARRWSLRPRLRPDPVARPRGRHGRARTMQRQLPAYPLLLASRGDQRLCPAEIFCCDGRANLGDERDRLSALLRDRPRRGRDREDGDDRDQSAGPHGRDASTARLIMERPPPQHDERRSGSTAVEPPAALRGARGGDSLGCGAWGPTGTWKSVWSADRPSQ